jgi:hypothetical protein
MLNEANRSYSQELTQLFPAVHIRATQRRYDADAHERAIQALRDVRHLLPREGVELVDAVLDETL